MVVRRPVRHLRSRPAAARLQGLSRGLPELPQPDAAVVPQSRRAWRPRLLGGAGRSASPRNTRSRTVPTTRAKCSTGRPARPIISRRRSPTTPGARGDRRRAAARHVGARQGARLRARLSLVPVRHRHASIRKPGVDYIVAILNGYEDPPTDFKMPAGTHYNKYVPRPRHRHAASRCPTGRSTIPTARRRPSISTPRTSPRS